MFRGGRNDRLSNAAENEELTVGFSVIEWIQEKKGVIEDNKCQQFSKVILLLREVEKELAGDPGWCRGFLFCFKMGQMTSCLCAHGIIQ